MVRKTRWMQILQLRPRHMQFTRFDSASPAEQSDVVLSVKFKSPCVCPSVSDLENVHNSEVNSTLGVCRSVFDVGVCTIARSTSRLLFLWLHPRNLLLEFDSLACRLWKATSSVTEAVGCRHV